MKASVKQEPHLEERHIEKEIERLNEESYEYYEQMEREQRQPYEEIIQYIKETPKLSLYSVDNQGKEDGSPLSVDTILNWEETHTNVYMSKVGDEPQIYIWRTLRRFEYLQALRSDGDNAQVDWNNDLQRQKFLINKCLLYPSPSLYFINNSHAGVLSTLETQILYKSGFVPDREAIQSISIIG